jgi:hypothetical protein
MPFSQASQALSRFTVLDLTRVRSGPTCVRQLADWGANVIQIDALTEDTGEQLGGPRRGADFQKKADVVVENFRPDVKVKLGIDYETLRKINPAIVYGSISGFGQDGPYHKRPRLRSDRTGHGRADVNHRRARRGPDAGSASLWRTSPPGCSAPWHPDRAFGARRLRRRSDQHSHRGVQDLGRLHQHLDRWRQDLGALRAGAGRAATAETPGSETFLQCAVREVNEELSYYFVPPELFQHFASHSGADLEIEGGTVRGELFVARDIPVEALTITEGAILTCPLTNLST